MTVAQGRPWGLAAIVQADIFGLVACCLGSCLSYDLQAHASFVLFLRHQGMEAQTRNVETYLKQWNSIHLIL
jgi:hypothetical protein